jgi:hypothetical protein
MEVAMRHFRIIFAITAVMMMVLFTACAPAPEAASSGETVEPHFPEFDPNNFSSSTVIDNKWDPMKPGTFWAYEGTAADDEGKSVDRRIEFTVTDLTKEIQGVRTVVGWIEDFTDGELEEKEIAFYAQDNAGNVWYFGEHPEEYKNGKFIEAPTWIAGFKDAKPGIVLMAKPQLGMPNIYQGWGPEVDWSDYGRVEQMGQETCVPVDCYKDVLVNAEANLSEPGAFQMKYFAPDVGEIQVGWKGTDATKEELQLVEYKQLSPQALADVRTKALEVEKHAYEVSEVYKQTSPSEYPVGTPALILPTAVETPQAGTPAGPVDEEILVYASDLPQAALSELDFIEDPASPDGKLIGLPNNGDELDPPPENDPHVTFSAQVQSGRPYRCWIHMKVGTPKGKSQANVIWVQFSGAVDKNNTEVFKPGSPSYMTAKGPQKEGWSWVGCEMAGTDSLVYFQSTGEVTIRLQAGAEGVGFDQFILSPTDFLNGPPEEAIVEK